MSVRQNCGNPPESPNMRWRAGAPTDQSGVSQKKKKHKNFRRRNASSWAPAGSVVGDREESKVRLNFRKYWSGVSPNSRLRANCRTVIPALKSRNLQFRCVSGSSTLLMAMSQRPFGHISSDIACAVGPGLSRAVAETVGPGPDESVDANRGGCGAGISLSVP
jgi:hypothetical protein